MAPLRGFYHFVVALVTGAEDVSSLGPEWTVSHWKNIHGLTSDTDSGARSQQRERQVKKVGSEVFLSTLGLEDEAETFILKY